MKISAAGRVIRLFGGARPLAHALGINPVSVYRWDKPRDKKGSEGAIPTKWHGEILKIAKKRGIDINKADLVNV